MHATLRRLAVATAFWGAGAGAAMAQPSLHLVAPGGGAGMTVAAVGGNAVVGGDGVAHVFDGVTGALLLTLTAPEQSNDFGSALAAVGPNILVGDRGSDTLELNAGAAYLYDGATGTLLLTLANPDPTINDDFGSSVSALGSNLLVGARRDDAAASDAGTVYLFDGSSGALIRTFTSPTPSVREYFGWSVTAVGGNVLVGAPQDLPVDPFPPAGPGGAYLLDSASGALLQDFANPTPVVGDRFGDSVAALGSNVLVGAHAAHESYLLDAATGALLLTFGGDVVAALGADVVTASPVTDSALVYDGTTGVLQRTLANPALENFGFSVAVLGDAVLVGTDASAFVFCGGAAGCGPCETCGPLGSCVLAPHSDLQCRTASDTNAVTLRLQDQSLPSADRVALKGRWAGGASSRGLFGNPISANHDVTLCVYDESMPTPALVFRATAPAAGTCGTRPCWTALGRPDAGRYRYADRGGTSDGLVGLTMGSFDGNARISLRGRGANLTGRPFGLPLGPLGLPLRAQVQVRDGFCWEAEFSNPTANMAGRFVAKSD
jgi:hypothetical protein